MYVNSLTCVRLEGNESKCSKIDIGVILDCVMTPWVFYIYVDTVVKEVKMKMRRVEVRFLEEGKEWRLHGIFYTDDLKVMIDILSK